MGNLLIGSTSGASVGEKQAAYTFAALAERARARWTDPRRGLPPEVVLRARQDPDAEAQVKALILQEIKAAQHEAQTRAIPFPDQTPEELTDKVFRLYFGLGPIHDILELPGVEDIAINGPRNWWIRTPTGWQRLAAPEEYAESDPSMLLLMFNHAISSTGKQASQTDPIVDAHLPGGHRLSVVTPPVIDETDPWPIAVIRKHNPRSFTVSDFLTAPVAPVPRPPLEVPVEDYLKAWREAPHPEGTLWTPAVAAFLHMAVLAELNIMVIGRTGTGKTSVIGALLNLIPEDRRVIIMEDTREIRLRQSDQRNVSYYISVTRGSVHVTMADLVRVALRQRPDHLVVGEARGAEITEVIKAIQTGHGGNITSVHAIGVRDAIIRVHSMYQESDVASIQRMDEAAIAKALARSFHLLLVTRLSFDGRRYLETVAALTGEVREGVPEMVPIFENTLAPQWYPRLTAEALPERLATELNSFGLSFGPVLEAERQQAAFLEKAEEV